MPLLTFFSFTFAGSLIWNGLLIKGGEWLGHYLADSQHILGWVIIGVIGATLVGYICRVFTWKPRVER